MLFPFAEYWWFYGLFLAFVLVMLALDLGVFNKKAHVVSFKEASIWSVVWAALEFLTGYVIEYSLSIDNIFVFVLVFAYFGIPAEYKHRVLFYGILGALVFRAIFI